MNHFRYFLMFTAVALLGAGCGAKDATEQVSNAATSSSQEDTILRLHFVGGQQVVADTRAGFLKTVLSMPESQALKAEILTKLSKLPIELIHRHGRDVTNDCASLIRPLLDDLASAESLFEMRGETNETPDSVLAIRLDETRAKMWETNLRETLETWTGLKVSPIPGGWELKKHHAPDLIRFVRAGDWVLIGAGQQQISLADEWLANIGKNQRPGPEATGYWLNVECDWDRLSKYVPIPESLNIPHISRWQLTVSARQDNDLATRIVVGGDKPFGWKPETWRIPTNLIRDKIISFTAAQGMGSWLFGLKSMQPFDITPAPDQFYNWTVADIPLQTYIALATENATNALEQLGPKLISLNPEISRRGLGKIGWKPDRTAILWTEVPFFLAPFIEAAHEPDGDFLFAGVFPNSPVRVDLPPGLIARFSGQTNLIYYDWEITSARMPGLRQITQLALLLSDHKQLDGESPGGRWISAIYPKLGNCVTEVTLTKPNEITLIRRSPIGLTSLELLALAHWIETPDFPLGGLLQPTLPPQRGPRHVQPTAPSP